MKFWGKWGWNFFPLLPVHEHIWDSSVVLGVVLKLEYHVLKHIFKKEFNTPEFRPWAVGEDNQTQPNNYSGFWFAAVILLDYVEAKNLL